MFAFKDYCLAVESVQDYLPDLYDRLRNDPKLQGDDLWFHFTSVPKLGINPKPNHRDPYGIYLFPRRWVASQELGRNHSFFSLPYVFAVRMKPGIRALNLETLSREDAERLLVQAGLQALVPQLDQPSRYGGTSPGQIFWQALDQYIQPERGRNGAWNAIFKRMGIDAIIDGASGAIHSNEPDQAVVFSPANLEVVDMIQNRVEQAHPNIIRTILTSVGTALFGDKITFDSRAYKHYEKTYSVYGNYKGYPFRLSMVRSRDPHATEYELREFSARITLSLNLANRSYKSVEEYIRAPYREDQYNSGVGAQIQNAVLPKFKKFMDQWIEEGIENPVDRSERLSEIVKGLMYYFGVGRGPIISPGQKDASFTRQYDWGTFTVHVGYESPFDSDEGWEATLNLSSSGRGSQKPYGGDYGNSVSSNVHGEKKLFPDDMPADEIVAGMIREMFRGVEHNIYKYHNPDPDSYRSDDYSRFAYSDRGRKLLSLLSRVRAFPRIRNLLPPEEGIQEDPHKQEVIARRLEVDFQGIMRGFNKRYPKLAALKRPRVRFDYNVEGVAKIYDYSPGVSVGYGFFKLPPERRDYELGKLIGACLIEHEVPPSFLADNLPGVSPEEFAEAFADYFIKGHKSDPDMVKAIQSVYMKVLSRFAGT